MMRADDRHRQTPGEQLVEQIAALAGIGADAMHSAPMVESGDTSTRWPPMFIELAIANGFAPPSCCGEPGHHRQERRQDHARGAAVDRHQPGQQRHLAGDRVAASRTGQLRRRSGRCPRAFSSTRDQHGHAADHHDHAPRHPLDRLAIVAAAEQHQDDGGGERAHADVHVEDDHADEQHGDHRERDPVSRLESARRRRSAASGSAQGTGSCCGTASSRRTGNSRRRRPARARAGCRHRSVHS